jgi:hypothetical protein
VWNEDLVKAFTARRHHDAALRKQSQFQWKKLADEVRAVKKDIYKQRSDGQIKNLPAGWSDNQKQKARRIIEGLEPVVPENMAYTQV